MKHTTMSSISFDVGHAAPYPESCLRAHGHTATITVAITGKPFADHGSFTTDPAGLLDQLRTFRTELEHRDLNEMIAPAKPTAAGLAGWVWERLALHRDDLAWVEVALGPLQARIDG